MLTISKLYVYAFTHLFILHLFISAFTPSIPAFIHLFILWLHSPAA